MLPLLQHSCPTDIFADKSSSTYIDKIIQLKLSFGKVIPPAV